MNEFSVDSVIYHKGTGDPDTIIEIMVDPKRAGAKTYRLESGIVCNKPHLHKYYTLTNPNP